MAILLWIIATIIAILLAYILIIFLMSVPPEVTILLVVFAFCLWSIISLEQELRDVERTHIKREVHEQLMKANDKAWKSAIIKDELKGMR